MIFLIAKKELIDNWQSRKIVLAFVLCAILFSVSFYLALKDYSGRLESYSLSRDSQDDFFASPVAHYIVEDESLMVSDDEVGPMGIFRHPTALNILARGLEDRMNRPVYFFNPTKYGLQIELDISGKQEKNKLFSLFSAPDFMYIVKIIVSLLCILFAFNTICGEREAGTLALMMSNSVSRSQILLGKWLGGYISVVAPFLAATFLALPLLVFSPMVDFTGEEFLRLGLIVVVALVYIAIFFLIGMLVSANTSQSSTAVMFLLAAWVLLVLVIPNSFALLAKEIVSVPSTQKIAAEKFAKARELEDEAQKLRPTDRGTSGYGTVHDEVRPKIEAMMKQIDQFYEAKRRQRLALSQILTRISPVGAYVYATTGLAQTGIGDEQKYLSQMSQYELQLEEPFNRLMASASTLINRFKERLPIDPVKRREIFWKEHENFIGKLKSILDIPATFRFPKHQLSETFENIWLDVLLLVAFWALFFLATHLSFLRYDVR